MKKLLIEFFGVYSSFLHGDLLGLDRWIWLSKNLNNRKGNNLLDVGAGSGGFSIACAKKYNISCTALSWDERNVEESKKRSTQLNVHNKVTNKVYDIRYLDKLKELKSTFDFVICLENIEHIINDKKLIKDISSNLKIGGTLFLTTPNLNYIPMGIGDNKNNLSLIEDGGHVRIGYSEKDCYSVCEGSGLEIEKIEYCSGFFSQKITSMIRFLNLILPYPLIWGITFPLRSLPIIFDPFIQKYFKWPGYSICFVAKKIK